MNQLPHNEDAERAVLGAILVNNFLLSQALAELEPDDFFIPRNRKIFVAMSEIGNEVSEIPLREHLKLSGEVIETSYLMNLRYGIPQLANISRYTRIVKQKSALRRIAHLAEAM
jgi:replicative DNA helicase